MSIPITANGNNPTELNTEYLPPTFAGISNNSYPSLSPSSHNLEFLSVVITIESL